MRPLYSPLLTDFYQFTMAYGYWKLGLHERTACFHLLFRRHPFKGKYTLSAGLETALSFLTNWQFSESDLEYLGKLKQSNGEPQFPPAFIDYLATLRFTANVDAIPEGTCVSPNAPVLRVEGPLLLCQLVESPLLNILNFQTLIATKAARIVDAAEGSPIIEFGMRRAQGPDGALSASRAAYIGGCVATSNTLAGCLYDIPVKGTHAHSWVSTFPSEQEAFTGYASIMPHQCTLLVDTYHTLTGVKHAIQTGKVLREMGADLQGIRLDSGDMADLSIKARKLLDDAGFHQTQILASNSLDEYVIQSLKSQGAQIDAWGVGTHLATAYDQPALDGVYKLAALQNENKTWEYKLKLSEQLIKVSNPGRHQVKRFYTQENESIDVIYDLDIGITHDSEIVLLDDTHSVIAANTFQHSEDLLQPYLIQGKRVSETQSIHAIRDHALEQRKKSPPAKVGMEKQLFELKNRLIRSIRAE